MRQEPGPGLIFVQLREMTRAVSRELPQTVWVTAEVPEKRRVDIAESLNSGALRAVVATDAWRDGINIPQLRWVLIDCWSKAPIGAVQRPGRGARLAEGKEGFSVYLLGKHAAAVQRKLVSIGFRVALLDRPAPDLAGASCVRSKHGEAELSKKTAGQHLHVKDIDSPWAELGRQVWRSGTGKPLDGSKDNGNLVAIVFAIILAILMLCAGLR